MPAVVPYGARVRVRPGSVPDVPGRARGEAVAVPESVSAFAVAGMWLAAGLLAAAVPHARAAIGLRRRVRGVLAALGAAAAASLLFTTPLLTAAAALALGIAVPRLARLHRAADGLAAAGPGVPVPPALRAAAAHPAVVVAVQAMAYASGAAPLLGPGLAALSAPALALALLLTLHGYAARHRSLLARALSPGPGTGPVVAARSYRGVAATTVNAG